ncbi:hypothetical protein SVIOM74S_10189 [Streptomyces violarus]
MFSRPQPLRRQVDQVQLAGEELGLHHPPLVKVLHGGLKNPARTPSARSAFTWSCIKAMSGETTTPVPGLTRDGTLIAEGLAGAGRHEHDRVAARDHVLDDRFLLAAEGLVSEDPVQRGQRLARLGARGRGAPARTGPAPVHRVQFRHHTRPARSAHRSVPRASRLDHCVHHRRPHRQPRSYPQAAPNACVKDTIVDTFAGDPARFRPIV